MRRILSAVVLVLIVGLVVFGQGKIVIGHRGAAGYLPEHTLAGYAFGYALGADYLEPDLVMTKDAHFICMHDIYLDPTTNVEQIFPDRSRSDGHWYAADFTLSEITNLTVHERCRYGDNPYFEDRFPVGKSRFRVPSFKEMIELVQGLNRSIGRDVGIYVEIKRPSWHEEQGLEMEQALINVLAEYGYNNPLAPIYIQCFEARSLKKMQKLETGISLIQLVGGGWNYASMWTEEGLDEIKSYAVGVGPSKTIIETNPEYVDWAHTRGLLVHPYTFRKDQLPAKYSSLQAEIEEFFFAYDVDGLFTDFVDVALAVLQAN